MPTSLSRLNKMVESGGSSRTTVHLNSAIYIKIVIYLNLGIAYVPWAGPTKADN